jgi:hypothetical protein
LDSLDRESLVIIDGLKYQESYGYRERLCDNIVLYFQSKITVAVVELTGGRMDAEKAKRQVTNGTSVAQSIMCEHKATNFLPLVLHGKGVHTAELKILDKVRVNFQGKRYRLIWGRCGASLKSIMERYPTF